MRLEIEKVKWIMEHSKNHKTVFGNANSAFKYYYESLCKNGIDNGSTFYFHNVGFYILNPLDNKITESYRKWKNSYADIEWDWYLSKNRSVSELKKHAKIWDRMHSGDDIVNSNYGYQWSRGNQIGYIVKELKRDLNSRRAIITIYDGKENGDYEFDTPCTLNIQFNIDNNKLNMSVLMRSNDIWFGFCNDQYCFSKLQNTIAKELNMEIGWYFHFANNLHVYKDKINKSI